MATATATEGPFTRNIQNNMPGPEATCSFPLNEGLWYKPVSSLQFWYNFVNTVFCESYGTALAKFSVQFFEKLTGSVTSVCPGGVPK